MRHPFLRTLAGASAAATDPNFENVTLLLHGDGTNGGQNNTFVDGSTNNFTITRNGNTTQGTFSPYGDNWSNYFDTSNTSLVATGTTSTGNLPTSTDFTIEFWWRSKLVNSGTGIVVAKTQFASTSADSWWLEVNGSNKVAFVGHSGTSTFTPVTSTTSVMDGVWHHCAVSRAGTTYRVFVDGALEQTTTNSTTMNQGSRNVTFAGITTIGGLNYGATGYISNLRIVVGTCLYTAAFTPSTAPLTSVTNTVLLTCQSNRFRDNGPNAYTISTQQGTPSVQRFSPFSPTAAYAAGTIGGSGYFDGTGDYLSVAATTNLNLSSGNWTVECWWYPNANTAQNPIMINYSAGTDGYAHARIVCSASPNVFLALSSITGSSWFDTRTGGSWEVGNWYHLAFVRSGSDFRLYVNGTSVLNYSSSSNLFAGNGISEIGRTSSSSSSFFYVNGYVSNARVVKGTAVYTSNFTPPTAPLTAITNTQLLCNFTNAAILDNAMMADLETVGNAQISTTVKKYGTGSLAFDGTGDWLRVQGTPNLFNLSTGDFTIECWFYAVSTGTSAIVQQGTTDWRISYTSSGVMRYEVGANSIQTSTGAFSFNTWTHLAICKSGATTTLYLNGTSRVTTTNSPTNSGNPVYVGANIDGGNPYWPLNGYIDDLRITKGVARYTANFTAPTAAFPDL